MNICETAIHKSEWDKSPVKMVYAPDLTLKGMCEECQKIHIKVIGRIVFGGQNLEEATKGIIE